MDTINWEYTQILGTGTFQPNGQPLYDGVQSNWVREEISLTGLTSAQVKFRFKLRTDGSQTRDGWYVDDIGILVYTTVPVELTNFSATPEVATNRCKMVHGFREK